MTETAFTAADRVRAVAIYMDSRDPAWADGIDLATFDNEMASRDAFRAFGGHIAVRRGFAETYPHLDDSDDDPFFRLTYEWRAEIALRQALRSKSKQTIGIRVGYWVDQPEGDEIAFTADCNTEAWLLDDGRVRFKDDTNGSEATLGIVGLLSRLNDEREESGLARVPIHVE